MTELGGGSLTVLSGHGKSNPTIARLVVKWECRTPACAQQGTVWEWASHATLFGVIPEAPTVRCTGCDVEPGITERTIERI